MFGTRLINSTVVTAMMITFVLIMIVLFILFIKDIGRNIVSIIVIILGISMLIVMTGIKIYSKKQGTDNIKKILKIIKVTSLQKIKFSALKSLIILL
jgi:hypothetical protein